VVYEVVGIRTNKRMTGSRMLVNTKANMDMYILFKGVKFCQLYNYPCNP